jgi:hypothetical protein
MESFGSYGSKIQTLVRHLLFLQVTEPGAKSIVFSAWADSLHSGSQFQHLSVSCSDFMGMVVIEHALQSNSIDLSLTYLPGAQLFATRYTLFANRSVKRRTECCKTFPH